MEDLEKRYIERVHTAQTRYDEAVRTARDEHDADMAEARTELLERSNQRFSVLFGKTAQTPQPSETARSIIEGMVEDALAKRLAIAAPSEPPTPEETASHTVALTE